MGEREAKEERGREESNVQYLPLYFSVGQIKCLKIKVSFHEVYIYLFDGCGLFLDFDPSYPSYSSQSKGQTIYI